MDKNLDISGSSLELAIAGSKGGIWSMRFAGDEPAQRIYDQVYCSPQIKAFIGFTDAQLPNSLEAWQRRILPEDLVRVHQGAQDHLEGKTDLHDVEYRIRHKDGSIRWIHSCGKIQRDARGVAIAWNGVGWDITERKKNEESLRVITEHLQEVQRIAHLGSWDWHVDTNELYWTDEIYRIFGLDRTKFDATYEAFLQAVHPDDRGLVKEAVAKALDECQPYSIEHRIIRPDGEVRYIHERAEVHYDAAGDTRMIGTYQDVTARRRSEAALRDSELRLKAVLASTLDPMVCIGMDGLIQFVSNSVERVFGWQTQELIGKNVNILIPQPYRDAHDNAMLNYCRTGKTSILGSPREMLAVRKDGSTFSCEITVWRVDLPDQDEPLITGIIRDITDRKASQELLRLQTTELEHASRLTMAGQMAAAMAHELSQPLGAIANYLEAGLRRIQSSESLSKQQLAPFNDAMDQVQHAGQIIRRTLNFLRRGQSTPTSVAINHEVHQAVLLMAGETRYRGITIDENFGDDLPTVQADSLHIRQVVCILMRNAIEAIDAGTSAQRLITIDTSCASQRHVTVAVSDSGSGFDQKMSSGLFEAFRSSKREGLGLGLWICRNILQSYHGDIALVPTEHGGARFEFWLPADGASKRVKADESFRSQ